MDTNTAPKIDLQISALEVVLAKATERQKSETIGQRLARLRRDRGITQAELADMLGMTQPMISGYEHGTLRLHGELIVELARILNVSADEILDSASRRAPPLPRTAGSSGACRSSINFLGAISKPCSARSKLSSAKQDERAPRWTTLPTTSHPTC